MVEMVMKYLERMRMSLTNIWPTGRHVLVHSGYLVCHIA